MPVTTIAHNIDIEGAECITFKVEKGYFRLEIFDVGENNNTILVEDAPQFTEGYKVLLMSEMTYDKSKIYCGPDLKKLHNLG